MDTEDDDIIDTPLSNEYEEFLQKVLKKQNDYLHTAENKEEYNKSNEIYNIEKETKKNMKKLYLLIEKSDIIIQVLDARMPNQTRNIFIEKYIKKNNKKIILLLNKIDLIPREILEKWINYLRVEYPTIAFKCVLNHSNKKIYSKGNPQHFNNNHIQNASQVFGASALMQLLKNYSRTGDTYKQITVGIIGYPNVGKSSLINSLLRRKNDTFSCNMKHVSASSNPGCTKVLQYLSINKHIVFIDSPGVICLEKKEDICEITLKSSVEITKIEDGEQIVEKIIKKCGKEKLMRFFKIADFENTKQFLYNVAQRRNKLSKNGVVDYNCIAKIILKEWNSGKIKFYCIPPNRKNIDENFLENVKIVDKLENCIKGEFEEIFRKQIEHIDYNFSFNKLLSDDAIQIESMDDIGKLEGFSNQEMKD